MILFRLAAAAALLLAASSAHAQEKTVRLDEQKIVGKIQKPEIQILITKQNLNPPYRLELKESFVPRIVQAVEQKPF